MSRISNLATGSPNATGILFNNNNISGYPVAGLALDAGQYTGPLNAENNYWGNPSGPSIASNPGGTGVTIVDPAAQVDFTPFSTSINLCRADAGTGQFGDNSDVVGQSVFLRPAGYLYRDRHSGAAVCRCAVGYGHLCC